MFNTDHNWEIFIFTGLVGPSVLVIEWWLGVNMAFLLGLVHSSPNTHT